MTTERSNAKLSYSFAPTPIAVRVTNFPRAVLEKGKEKGYKSHSPLPTKVVRLATVSLYGRRKNSKQAKKEPSTRIKYKDDEAHTSLEECIQSRPPLKFDLSGPKPTSFDPPRVLPWETKSPAYTMRPKTEPEKDVGGDRVSWGKQWFASPDIWTLRTKFDVREPWPSPACYKTITAIGSPHATLPQSPSHSIAKRKEFIISKKGSENEPAPNQYDYDRSKQRISTKYPSYTIQQGRRGGTALWSAKEPVPGPGTYSPKAYVTSCKKVSPAYTWPRGERKIGITMNCTF